MSWSGGTVANLEALWIARNIRLYPPAVRLVAEQTDAFESFADLEVTTATGERTALRHLSTWRWRSTWATRCRPSRVPARRVTPS